MKKIETSLIKGLMRISLKDFAQFLVNSVLELSLYSLSLTHSWTLRVFLEHFSIGLRKENKATGRKYQERKGKI